MNTDIDLIGTTTDDRQKVPLAYDDDNEPLLGFIIVSKESSQYIQRTHELRSAGIKFQAVKARRIDSKTDEGAAQLDKLIQTTDLEIAIAVVVDWFGFTKGGEPAPFDSAKVRVGLIAHPTWREKITAALENEAGFLPSLTTSSALLPQTSSG